MGLRDLIPAIEWGEAPGMLVVGDDFNSYGSPSNPVVTGPWDAQNFDTPESSLPGAGTSSSLVSPPDPDGDGTDGYAFEIDTISGGVFGDVFQQNAIKRTFGVSDGLAPGATYHVTVELKLHQASGNIGNVVTTGNKNAIWWGLYVEGASAYSDTRVEQASYLPDPPFSTVREDPVYVNPYPYWQTFRTIATTDGSGNLTVKFGIFRAHNFFAVIHYDNVRITELSSSYRLLFPYPPEDVRSFRRPLPGSQRLTLPSGETDAWTLGNGGIWTCEARWIPAVSQLALPDNDGWEDRDDAGVTRGGWDRFLRHAAAGGEFTFYPDSTDPGLSYQCVWDEASAPLAPALEDDMTRLEQLAFRTTDGALITGYSQ